MHQLIIQFIRKEDLCEWVREHNERVVYKEDRINARPLDALDRVEPLHANTFILRRESLIPAPLRVVKDS